MTYLEKIKKLLARREESENANRIISEIVYLDGVSQNNGNAYNGLIEKAVDWLFEHIEREGVITKSGVLECENILLPMQDAAKQYTLLFVGHAHIDMNWMWGYNETASVTVDTFRTILDLMREYPEFTYGQSQASTYEIIEKYAPEMLPEIKQRIREGRWEVTAAEWVEPDKNMPDGESLTRQILESTEYLTRLLEIPRESICVDFVPDTFGHNANVPEILTNAGIKYMYHCRGYNPPCIYKFMAPSGKYVIAYREYEWYNGEVTTNKLALVPGFCRESGMDTALCVFGLGDHGGGPSRRDIERIIEYRNWPLTPVIRFGTYREFFEMIEERADSLPVVQNELNCLFTGCYTTQSRIKMANRIGEARLNEAEAYAALNTVLTGAPAHQERLKDAWRNLLFNHFHDILPGSGTVETREYAMGKFQEILASAATTTTSSLQNIAKNIDTSAIEFDLDKLTRSEGGGTGFFQDQKGNFRMPSAEHGRGKVRVFHVFNPTEYLRDEVTEIVVWDYFENIADCEMVDFEGNQLDFFKVGKGAGYWGHTYVTLKVKVKIAPYGYTTVILRPKKADGHIVTEPVIYEWMDEHINDEPIVLENDKIRAVFDHQTVQLVELTDKASGKKLISSPSCYFRLAQENTMYWMTSWRLGPLMDVRNLNATEAARISATVKNDVLNTLSYSIKFGNSELRAEISLKKGSTSLEYAVHVDWNEAPVIQDRVPQLAFVVPVSYENSGECVYDIPYGIIKRGAIAHDVPALSFAGILGEDKTVGVISDSKYGYRYYGGEVSVTLIRSAYDPDPYPERGIHDIRLAVALADSGEDLIRLSRIFNHPVAYVSAGSAHGGTLPLEAVPFEIDGTVKISSLKNSEDNTATVIRMYDVLGKEQNVNVRFASPVGKVFLTDTNEISGEELAKTDECGFSVTVLPYSAVTVKVSKI